MIPANATTRTAHLVHCVIPGIEELEKEYKARQLELATAHQELEKRIVEHDTLIAEGNNRSDLTLPAIHDAEGELEAAKMRSETIRQKLQEARLHLRGSEEGSYQGFDLSHINLLMSIVGRIRSRYAKVVHGIGQLHF